jgi:dipeptidyl aminopeptidase/acylaminoacyl peptidase
MTVHYRAEPDGRVQDLTLPKQDKLYYLNVHYAEAERGIYWTQFDEGRSELQIWRFDMATAARTLVKSASNKMTDVVIDKAGRLAGIETEVDRTETQWTDPARVNLVSAVEKIFPKATVTIADMTDDGKVVVFLISAPDAPDSYYLYDSTAKSLDEIGTRYPELEDKALGEMTYITYKARDGLDIPAYVVKRKDTPPGAPLVVMPHGGPAARDVYAYNYMAQALAWRGYVVLEPEYRGSYGFGDTYQQAGNKHLAQMTTDLEDGVRYLQAQGTIDPKKVCVFGWSWGGYLAQAALAFTPKTYVCGVSGDGIADLYEVLDEGDDMFWGGYSAEYWRSVIGQPMLDAAAIHATSPIEHITDIQAPLLLIHGSEDRVVSKHQSEHMNAAMQKAGKTVTYLPIQYMHHGPEKYSERLAVMTAVDDFIAKAFATVK